MPYGYAGRSIEGSCIDGIHCCHVPYRPSKSTKNYPIFQIFSQHLFQANAVTYAAVIAKALNYIYQTLLTLDDTYSLAIAAYAAQLANYEHKAALLQKLDALAKVQGNFNLLFS